MQAQTRVALSEADAIVFITDSRTEPLPQDFQVVELLRKLKIAEDKPVIFGISKCDDKVSPSALAEFYVLGFGDPVQISAIHNKGIEDLIDRIQRILRELGYRKKDGEDEIDVNTTPKFALVGRPNVGKSSLVNAYLTEERLIVSDVSGTTRDSTDTEIRWEKQPFIFIDTAGIRKRGKIEDGIEKWALARTLQSIDKSDVVGVLLDGEEGITSQDQHVVEYALEAKKGIILIVNKWDTQEKGEEARNAFVWSLRERFPFLPWAPVLFVSAKNKTNIVKIFPLIQNIVEERSKRISTGKLNAFLREIMAKHHPTGTKTVRPKIFYMSQVDINPPKFKVFVNKQEYFHFSYFRYLENNIREYFGFHGTSIDIEIKDRDSIFEKPAKGKRRKKS